MHHTHTTAQQVTKMAAYGSGGGVAVEVVTVALTTTEEELLKRKLRARYCAAACRTEQAWTDTLRRLRLFDQQRACALLNA